MKMIKGNQRSNGLYRGIKTNNNLFSSSFNMKKNVTSTSGSLIENDLIVLESSNQDGVVVANNFDGSSSDNNYCNVFNDEQNKLFQLNMKEENLDDDFDNKNNLHSIIGLSNELKTHSKYSVVKPKIRKNNLRGTYHETLQRIDPSNINHNHYQQHWFSSGLERLKLEDRSRQERLEITRYELRRHLKQILRSNVGTYVHSDVNTMFATSSATTSSSSTSSTLNDLIDVEDYYYLIQTTNQCNNKSTFNYERLVAARKCDMSKCNRTALPCTIYCLKHIMNNKGQVLFNYCTAKFADNRQCSQPVFDILHELPLCPEHARKRDNYKMYQETKPKKLRKKVKTSAMIRPQKRNKKKKKIVKNCLSNVAPVILEHSNDIPDVQEDSEEFVEDMVEQVLAMDVDHNLITQATHLLEEPDITNVLNTIQADEFSDFFTVNRNGEYEPTREETEELERALAAVDNDVKSLEKLSQSHGLLDSLLDEQTLVESLVQIPDMFHNGYVVPSSCGSGSVSVIDNNHHHHMVIGQTNNSRLLQVEPHSQT